MSKYYTPEIEEFIYGLKYEMKPTNYGWERSREFLYPESIHDLIHLHGPTALEPYINKERIRVKYLDREDIESLGFKGQEANSVYYKRDGYRLVLWPHGFITSIYKVYNGSEEEKIFDGCIKNKSELKKLLKQLKIIE